MIICRVRGSRLKGCPLRSKFVGKETFGIVLSSRVSCDFAWVGGLNAMSFTGETGSK